MRPFLESLGRESKLADTVFSNNYAFQPTAVTILSGGMRRAEGG